MIRPEDQPGTQVDGVSEIVDVKTEIVEVEDVQASDSNQPGTSGITATRFK